jgi:hypothetical protein
MIMFLNVVLFAAEGSTGKQDANTLPWKIIAEKFDAKKPFCRAKSEDGKTVNFAFAPDATTITLPSNVKIPQPQTEIELNLSVWQQDQWTKISPIAAHIDPNGLTVDSNTLAEGFYNLVVCDENDIGKEDEFLAVVSADWKKDLLGWCKTNKEQIETNPDPQLIYSSIAVSHFDNVMELANKSTLSENIFPALSKAIKAKADFEDGNCPDLVIGVNKIRLKRFEGASVAEFAVNIPTECDESKHWPIYLHADPVRWGVGHYGERGGWGHNQFHEGMIDIWWHTVTHKNIAWDDFAYLKEILKQKLSIDEKRQYLFGLCGDGLAAMALLVNYPDQWAECMFSTGNSYRHLAGNAFNVKVFYGDAHPENESVSAYMYFAAECLKYYGLRDVQYIWTVAETQSLGSYLPRGTINLSPYRIFYTIETLDNSKAYWVQIDGREDENFIASIDAVVWGQSILVKTDNIDAYTFNLQQAPLDCNRPVDITENGKFLKTVTGPVFVRKSPKYENALYVKTKSLHGPVSDVFTDRYAVVWKGDDSIKRLAGQLAGSGPCFEDVNLPADFINTHNIIFVGRLNESRHFAQIAGKLPVVIEDGKLTANGKVYEEDLGAIYVYPNPLNAQKYLAIFSGTTDKASGLLNSAWNQIKSKDNVDIGIFQAGENNKIQWLICEKFNTVWNWHKSWDVPLVKLEKTYPKWKWRQWVARVLREQLKADVMISEDPFSSSELPDSNELTLRDMARIFTNDWIVKISLKGSDLRELLMVPFNDISSREVSAPVIDGASLVKQPSGSDVICFNELEPDKFYTVAFPYKAVNGKRMGMVMDNYQLEGEGFLVVLLKEYLEENINFNLDAELDGMQLNIF